MFSAVRSVMPATKRSSVHEEVFKSTPTVDAAFDHSFERLLKLALIDIVLVLAHADGLGIDLHQLRERVLQAAGNGDGAAHGQIEIGKLLPRNGGGGVDAGAGLADGDGKDAVDLLLAQKLAHKGIGLARGGAVADGDGAHVVLAQQGFQLGRGFGVAVLRGVQIEHIVRQQLAGLIHHRNLAAGAQAGIDAQHGDRSGGRREQQVIKIVAEDVDGLGVGAALQLQANLALNGGIQQALPRVVNGQFQLRRPIAGLAQNVAAG